VSAAAVEMVFARPLIYDVAFSYRDVSAEVDLLLAWATRVSGQSPRSALELAAGPADHAIAMARRHLHCAAIDRSSAMCSYARQRAAEQAVVLRVHQADMVDFSIGERFDLACTMLSSLMFIYTLDHLVQHLRCVARHLEPGGVYIIEMPHPADFLTGRGRTSPPWSAARDGLEVEVRWGRPDDPYAPLTQTLDALVEYRVRRGDQVELFRERTRMREWLASEFEAAVLLSGAFETVERHGAFELDAPLDSSEASWRMIQVLRRRDA
jgi:SAM-dependent methyltransferase